MKKILVFLVIITSFYISFWINVEKKNYLINLWIPEKMINDILSKKQVSRYDIVRVLNYALCYNCMLPPKSIKEKYNKFWFDKLKKQPSFYLDDINQWNKYYYCIVSLAEKNYIHWYPPSNPVCWKKFCWTNAITLWELYQIAINIISNRIMWNYIIDNPQKFYKKLLSIKWKLDQKKVNILDSDYEIAKKIYQYKNISYKISSFKEFFLYQKYCNLFPSDCGFSKYWTWKNLYLYTSLLNILYKENFISLPDAVNFNPDKIVSWNMLINWLYKLQFSSKCKIDKDYDKDWINNSLDNCVYSYNPNQKDTDKDWIWDVCDDDINNDWIKNPVGIVDDEWNIVREKLKNWKWKKWEINKIIDSINSNKEIKGFIWIKSECNPLLWEIPLNVVCNAIVEWNIEKILRIYDWNIIWQWNKINYTFKNSWNKKIQAIAIAKNWQAKSNVYFHIIDRKTSLNAWLSIRANHLIWTIWSKITFYPKIIWKADYIKWDFWDWSSYKKLITENPVKKYLKQWTYNVKAYAIKSWKIVGKSTIYIKIYKSYLSKKSFYIMSNRLMWFVNDSIKFTVVPINFKNEEVDHIKWDFWDWSSMINKVLNISYSYKKSWAFLVSVSVYLKSWKVLYATITEKIMWNDKSYWAVLISNPLKSNILEPVNFEIIPKWFKNSDISSVTWFFWDWIVKRNNILKTTHSYGKYWSYFVKVIIKLINWKIINVSLTQLVIWERICSNNGKARKILHCDIDKDWIPDMCDSDIDWDWIKNLLWMIKNEPSNCKYSIKNLDKTRFKEEQRLARKSNETDNCPFIENPDQIDIDKDWIWNKCEWKIIDKDFKDTDWDWIADVHDECPTVPESYNWIEDLDGCPEINITDANKPKLQVVNCNYCPCQFADWTDPFMFWLKIQAALVDPIKYINIYNFSEEKTIEY